MRTTLSIDDDVLHAAKERAHREHRTVGEVISDLARRGLTAPASAPHEADEEPFHGFAPLPHRGYAVSNELIDRLREDDPE
jgi:hypothetical protein